MSSKGNSNPYDEEYEVETPSELILGIDPQPSGLGWAVYDPVNRRFTEAGFFEFKKYKKAYVNYMYPDQVKTFKYGLEAKLGFAIGGVWKCTRQVDVFIEKQYMINCKIVEQTCITAFSFEGNFIFYNVHGLAPQTWRSRLDLYATNKGNHHNKQVSVKKISQLREEKPKMFDDLDMKVLEKHTRYHDVCEAMLMCLAGRRDLNKDDI